MTPGLPLASPGPLFHALALVDLGVLTLKRRQFIAALPAAAIAAPLAAQSSGGQTSRGETGPPAPEESPLPRPETYDRPDVHAGDRPVGASFASRSAVWGTRGAAGSSHPLATLAGIEILKKGGSAADAAIAMNACLGFLETTAIGIGGD